MNSMTGFGRGAAPLGDGRIVIELKTVNHRFLEIRSRAPKELVSAEAQLEKLVRSHLERGHCTVFVGYEGQGGGTSQINQIALSSYLEQLKETASANNVDLPSLLPILAGTPDIFTLPSFSEDNGLAEAVNKAFAEAVSKLKKMRESEGNAMARDINNKLSTSRETVTKLAAIADGYAETLLERTRQRIATLLEGTELEVDKSRVEAEAAFLADKADVNEEITRLKSHCDQMATTLEEAGPIGRRLEFLVQEMGREANTIGSKAATAELSHLVVKFKAELEKIRELVQNVE